MSSDDATEPLPDPLAAWCAAMEVLGELAGRFVRGEAERPGDAAASEIALEVYWRSLSELGVLD